MNNTNRFEVRDVIKFGMLFGYVVHDNVTHKNTPYEYDEDDKWRANSKCELLNLRYGDKTNPLGETKINTSGLKMIIENVLKSVIKEDGTFTDTFNSNQPVQPQKPANQPADVKTYGNVQTKATAANKAASRINTTTEFSGAFKNWFASLGYKPENNTVTISRVQMLVKQAMTELGYK